MEVQEISGHPWLGSSRDGSSQDCLGVSETDSASTVQS